MSEQLSYTVLSTDLGLSEELKNAEFRNQFFRTERGIDIPAQLRSLRKLRDLTQQELSEKTGMKQSAISRLERSDHGKWNLETLVLVAEALDARLSVLIEPYEVVIARYAAPELRSDSSALLDEVESAQSPPRASIFEEHDNRYEQKPPMRSLWDAPAPGVREWN